MRKVFHVTTTTTTTTKKTQGRFHAVARMVGMISLVSAAVCLFFVAYNYYHRKRRLDNEESSAAATVPGPVPMQYTARNSSSTTIITTMTANPKSWWWFFLRRNRLRLPPAPFWAQKYDNLTLPPEIMNNNNKHDEPLLLPQLCFLHVGKTAGTSLRCALGFLPGYDDCGDTAIPQSLLPVLTTHLVHNNVNDCRFTMPSSSSRPTTTSPQQPTTTTTTSYLIATRHPIQRIISWFIYEYPKKGEYPLFYKQKKPLYLDCPFDSINTLAEAGLGGGGGRARSSSSSSSNSATTATTTTNVVVSPECQQRAYNAIQGKTPYSRHNYYNYRHYWEQIIVPTRETPVSSATGSASATTTIKTIDDDVDIYVIRTEHMVDDWNAIERVLYERYIRSSDITNDNNHNSNSSRRLPYQVTADAFPRSNKTPDKKVTATTSENSTISLQQQQQEQQQHQSKYLSPHAKTLLCAALCDEIQIYKTILKRAINLNESDYEQSIQELAATCPIQATNDLCHNNDDNNKNDNETDLDIQPPVSNWMVLLMLTVTFVLWKKKHNTKYYYHQRSRKAVREI